MAFSRSYKDHFRQMPKLASIDRALENCCPHNYKARRPYKKWLRFERLSVLIFMTTSIISQPITSLSHGIRRLYWHYVPHTGIVFGTIISWELRAPLLVLCIRKLDSEAPLCHDEVSNDWGMGMSQFIHSASMVPVRSACQGTRRQLQNLLTDCGNKCR